MNKMFLVAKREYFSRVRKVSFWLSTLFFPLFIIVIGVLSGLGTAAVEDLSELNLENLEQPLLVLDESGLVARNLPLPELVEFIEPQTQTDSELNEAIERVKELEAEALIYYPPQLTETLTIQIYTKDQGLFANGKYDGFANALIVQSAQSQIDNPNLVTALNANFATDITAYEDGQVVETGLGSLVFPILSLIIYVLLVTTGSGYMLQSVSEEKENRMIEVILSSISSRELIWGKIIGLIGVVLTQLLALVALSVVPFLAFDLELPVDLAGLTVTVPQLLLAVFYIMAGFATLSGIMVGLAAAMPSYKEAQSFSGVFYIIGIFPLYLFSVIIADPGGIVATVLSYVPIASPLVFIARSAFDALGTVEIILSVVINIVYVVISFYAAFALFEIGSLEYTQKLGPKQILSRLWQSR